jgi:O-antigen ligase
VFLVAAAVLLMLSHSAGALSCCVLVIAAMPLWRLTRLNRARRLSLFAVIAIAAIPAINYISDNAGLIFLTLGRDSTLTGRTHLWSLLLSAIAKHPILGYGYGAFWTGLKGEALNVWIGSGWLPQAADNGYLDLCLSLGLVGACAFGYLWLRCFLQGKTYVASEPAPIGLWPVTFLCFFLIHNVCESTLTGGSFPFLVFTVLATSLAVDHQAAVAATRVTDCGPAVQEWAPRAFAG